MRSKPQSCSGCPCAGHGTDFTRVEGTGANGVLICAEASGEHEAREGTPLVKWAPAGSLLERTFKRMGLDRQQFSITNTLRCRPKNNWLEGAPWEYSALRHCRPNLDAAIRERRPRAIFALGNIPLRELTGMTGEARGISHMCGYVLPLTDRTKPVQHRCKDCDPAAPTPGCLLCDGTGYWDTDEYCATPDSIPVIPTLHPAFIRRGKASLQGIFARHLSRALNVASGRDRLYIWDLQEAQHDGRLRYQTHPSPADAESFLRRVLANSGAPLSYDLETFESASLDEDARDGFSDTRIRLIQFSLGAGEGIAFPWEGVYRTIAQRLLHTPNVKCGHNTWLFDQRVLRAVGEREGIDLAPRGTIHDTLQMFHHWQPDLPAHLQFAAQFVQFPFPWKHLAGTDLEFYGCVDVDATLRLYNMLVTTMARDGIWGDGISTGYTGQVLAVRPVLAAMEDRGLPVDDTERLKLDVEFDAAQQELGAELDRRFPDEARSIHPKHGYKKIPKDCSGLVLRDFLDADVDDAGNAVSVPIQRWCRLEPFTANSAPQLIRYMKACKHKVPKSRKNEDADGNAKDTTEKKELVRLAHRYSDNFYLKVIEYRELSKMRGTYIEGFKPHADGCAHTTFTFDTGIGQLSSRNPNIQNFPKHGRLAKACRRMIAAKPGYLLSEWDYKSCHVLTLGYLAEDPDYIRIARLDMHSFVTGHALGLWDGATIIHESDDQLRARFQWLKSNPEYKHVRDARMKHAILGVGNGLKAKGLFEKHMEDFSSQKQAQQFLDIIERLFPRPFSWQKRVQKLAHEQTFLKTEFGHIRRFYEVYRWDFRKGCWGHGDQGEEAISFWLSNIAFGHIREGLKAVDRAGVAEKYGLCNNVHDSLMFHFPESMLEKHIADVYPILSAPSKILIHPTIAPEGLYIDVECNVGRNWAEMEEVAVGKPALVG